MHTSEVLRSSHFQVWHVDADTSRRGEFSTFCSNYHEQDRAGVVSPRLEDGILHAGYALLALTTAFYDVQRSRTSEYFIYPQHFAFIDADYTGVSTGAGRLAMTLDDSSIGAAWGWLDVWPASNWIATPGTPAGILQKIFDFQINRLFWPQNFEPEKADGSLPTYARKLLKARLKSVYYYNSSTPTVEICAAQPAADIVQQSIDRLPKAVLDARQEVDGGPPSQYQPSGVEPGADDYPYRESYRQVTADDFLEDMDACFK